MYETRMPFGKYCGWPLSKVPIGYLHQWALANCIDLDPRLRSEIRNIVEQAERNGHAAYQEPRRKKRANLPARWDQVIPKWFREMAMRYHPDRGGSPEVMQALNHAHERLKELAGV